MQPEELILDKGEGREENENYFYSCSTADPSTGAAVFVKKPMMLNCVTDAL